MSLTVQIVIDVAGQSPGSPGVARIFDYSVIGSLVTLSLADTSGVTSYEWRILDQPEGATATLSDSSVASPTFTPTAGKSGTYLIECIVNGGEAYGRNAVAYKTELWEFRKPAAGETVQFDITKGWKPELSSIMDKLDASPIPPSIGSMYFYINIVSTEYTIGAVVFNGDELPSNEPGGIPSGMAPKLRFIGKVNDPGTLNAEAEIRLYDIGTQGELDPADLRAKAILDASVENNETTVKNITLTPVDIPSSSGEIKNAEKVYEIRAYLVPGGGSAEMWVYKVELIVE